MKAKCGSIIAGRWFGILGHLQSATDAPPESANLDPPAPGCLATSSIVLLCCFGVQYRWIGFWALASFVSFLHAIPGWAYGLFSFSGNVKNHKDRTEWFNTVFVDGKASPFWTKVYVLPQALTYFMSSLAGFAALFIILQILRNDL
jgi:hypothetical protein